MSIVIKAIFFLLGISIGSFLNVLIDRIPRGESVVKGRSYCEDCNKELRWYDLIPLFSFIQIKGRCRYCKVKLSLYYPVVELITGISFVFIFWYLSNNSELISINNFANLVYILYIVSSLIVIFFIDLKYGIIPDKILYPLIFISLTFNFLVLQGEQFSIFNFLLSGIGSFLFFLLIFLITKGKGMGLGDVKFSFFMGLFLGFPKVVMGFYLAFLTGAIVSIILVVIKKRKLKGGTVPFGPFLVIGSIISYFWGEKLLKIFFGGLF